MEITIPVVPAVTDAIEAAGFVQSMGASVYAGAGYKFYSGLMITSRLVSFNL